jgi:hypothetical protein
MPLPLALIGTLINAAPSIIEFFGNKKQADTAEKVIDIAKQITGEKEPEKAVEAIAANPELALQFERAVMDNKLEFKKLDLEEQRIYVNDVQDARKFRDERTFWLGVSILCIFCIAVVLVLIGSYFIIVGKLVIDAGIFAALTGMIGTLVGYTAANAQAVVNYFFGSSHGSMVKSDELSDSIKKMKSQ